MTPSISGALLLAKSDATLVALAQGGSDAAFSAIVERYRRSLRRHCRTLLPDHQTDDAVQQAFLRALQALRSGSEVRELGPWLHRIARNVALSELAARGAGHDELSADWEDCGRAAEVERRAELTAALTAIASLPDRQRTAVVRSASGASHAAIASELGMSEVAARQLLHRARTTLRASVHVVLPPPVLWLARRVHHLARRADVLTGRLPAPPPMVEPFLPKVIAVVVAAATVAAPVSLMHADGPHRGRQPVTAVGSPMEIAARSRSGGSDLPSGPQSRSATFGELTPPAPGRPGASAQPSRAPASTAPPAAGVRTSAGTASGASNHAPAAAAMETNSPGGDPNADAPAGSDSGAGADATDQVATDPSPGDASATDPGASDSTGSSTDPVSTDPTSTDASAPGPASADPSGSGAPSPDPTSTDPTATTSSTGSP